MRRGCFIGPMDFRFPSCYWSVASSCVEMLVGDDFPECRCDVLLFSRRRTSQFHTSRTRILFRPTHGGLNEEHKAPLSLENRTINRGGKHYFHSAGGFCERTWIMGRADVEAGEGELEAVTPEYIHD